MSNHKLQKTKNSFFTFILIVSCLLISTQCTSNSEKVVNVTENVVSTTNNLYIVKTAIEQKTLVGSTFKVIYENLWEPNSVVFKGLGATMTSIAKNKKQVTGAVHVIIPTNPVTTDSLTIFIGVPVNNTKGFLPNELYTITGGNYLSSTAVSDLKLVKDQHQNMQTALKNKGYAIQFPIIEVWASGIITDKLNNNKINMLYPN